MSTYKHDFAAFADEVLAADWMAEEMKRRALLVADRALEIAPVSDEPGDHYVDHFRVDTVIRESNQGRRVVGRVINDHPAAVDIEYGSGPQRPQGGGSPRFRVLGRALDAAGE